MTRRFWVGLVARRSRSFVLEMGGDLFGLEPTSSRPSASQLGPARPGDAGRAVGRLAVLRARLELGADAGTSTCSRSSRWAPAWPGCSASSPPSRPGIFPDAFRIGRRGRRLLRGRRRHHRPRPARPGPRAARPRADLAAPSAPCSTSPRRPRAARARTAPRRTSASTRSRSATACGSAPARRSRSTGGRRGPDAAVDESMVTGESMPVTKDGRRHRHRRHRQPDRLARHARREGRPRHDAGPHRADGRRGAAHPRAHPAARRPGRGLVRARRHRGRRARVRRVGAGRTGAAARPRPRRRRRGPHHRLPLRARPRHADVDHGRRRPRRAGRRADQERRGARADGEGRHPRRRQDRHADRGQARRHRIVPAAGFDEARGPAARGRVERASEHPLALAIVRGGRRRRASRPGRERLRLPVGKGALGTVEGGGSSLGSATFLAGHGVDTPADAEADRLRADGATPSSSASTAQVAGVLAIADPVKETTPEALAARPTASSRHAHRRQRSPPRQSGKAPDFVIAAWT